MLGTFVLLLVVIWTTLKIFDGLWKPTNYPPGAFNQFIE